MVEHTLGSSLAASVLVQLCIESERLRDGQEGLDGEHGCWMLLCAEHLSTALVERAVNPANGVFGAVNFDLIASKSRTTRS